MIDPITLLTAISVSDLAREGVKAIMSGVIGSQADAALPRLLPELAKWYRGEGRPVNHDLRRAFRLSYLSATAEVIKDSESVLWQRNAQSWLESQRVAVRENPVSIPEPPNGWEPTLVVEPTIDVAKQDVRELVASLKEMLLGEWLTVGLTPVPARIARRVETDWFELISLYFREFTKDDPRVQGIFLSTTVSAILIELRDLRAHVTGPAVASPPPFWAPALPDHFVGRDDLLGVLRQRLSKPGAIVPLTGMPGLGKTLLATKFAHEYGGDFEGVYWVACAGLSPLAVATTLSEQLGLKPEGELSHILAETHQRLARHHNLLVLDNVDSQEFESIVPQTGRTSVLITSRLGDLPFLVGFEPPDLRVFTLDESLALFRWYGPPESVSEHEAEYRTLAERLGYLPIGISVAAGLLKRDVRYTLGRLLAERNLHQLVYGQHDLGRLFDLAIESVPEESQRLLSACAACAPAGFRLGLAAQISQMSPAVALDAMQELRDRSLVDELDRATSRFRVHALLRARVRFRTPLDARHAHVVAARYEDWVDHRIQCDEDLDDWRFAFECADKRQSASSLYLPRLASAGFAFLYTRGLLAEARTTMQAVEKVAATLGDRAGLQRSYGNQALILKDWGRLDEAMALHKKEEAICEELGDRAGLGGSYCNQALILLDWGRLDGATVLLKKQEAICEELGDRAGLHRSYGNQALILKDWGRLDEAMALHKKEEAICEKLGDRADLHRSYGNQALILQDWGRLDEAMALHKKKEAICEELGERSGLQRSYGNQALILRDWGRLDEAMTLLKEQEAICEELGERTGLQRAYGNQALILKDRGRLDEAMALLKKQEAICEELGERSGLQRSYANQALILKDWGRLDEAMALHKKEEAICEKLGDRAGLQASNGNQALILLDWGRLDEAMALMKKQEAICEELGDRVGLQRSFGNQAVILKNWGRLDEAMALQKKKELICRNLNLKDSLRISLVNQSFLLKALNRPEEAASQWAEAESLRHQIYGDRKE